MWKQKLCLGIGPRPGMEMADLLELVRQTGFEAVFTDWDTWRGSAGWAKQARERDLIYQSVHAPFGKAAAMWGEDQAAGDAAVTELIRCLEDTSEIEVPIMVAHAFIGFRDHTPTQAGIDRYGQVIDRARQLGVKVALENTEGIEYLDALLRAFAADPAVGFCWDTGHEMCYNYSRDLLALYGDQLICTHINDNLGIRDFGGGITFLDDLHLLPFDGIGNWADIAARLDRCGYRDILTFELNLISKPRRHENDCYTRMPLQEYIAECYKRACRVAALRKIKMA